jgi:DNA-binding GntR family transcriptional regulator
MAALAIRKIQRNTLTSDCYGAVRKMLLDSGQYGPGEKISIEALSRDLGVSRTPVWMAIARLEAEGIINIRPRRGVFVVQFDLAKVLEAFQVREILEAQAARLSAARISNAELAGLARAIREQRKALAARDLNGYAAAAQSFDDTLLHSAGNETIEQVLSAICARIKAMCSGLEPSIKQVETICDQQEKILAALRARDADRAESEARAHVQALAASVVGGGPSGLSPSWRMTQSRPSTSAVS